MKVVFFAIYQALGVSKSERARQTAKFELKNNPNHALGADFGLFFGLRVVYRELTTSSATVSIHTIEHSRLNPASVLVQLACDM